MAQRQPNNASAGLAKVAIGNMQTQHGFELLLVAWEGKPDFYSQGMVVNHQVFMQLGLFGESGVVLAKLYEFEWCVAVSATCHCSRTWTRAQSGRRSLCQNSR